MPTFAAVLRTTVQSRWSPVLAACLLVPLTVSEVSVQERPPTFLTLQEAVVIDLTVVADGDGSPIPDLTAADLKLEVDGKPREIGSLAFLRLAVEVTGQRHSTNVPPPITAKPSVETGRLFVLLGIGLVPDVERFLEKLQPNDRVAVVKGPDITELTSDRARIRKALQNREGGSARGPCGTERSLIQALTKLALIAGPKSVVTLQGFNARGCADYAHEITRAAAEARATFFVIQPLVFTTSAKVRTAPSGVGGYAPYNPWAGDLAGITGGEFFRPAASLGPIFDRILRGSTGYYELSFATLASERDGKPHKIKVAFSSSSRRDGARILAQPSFVIRTSSGGAQSTRQLLPNPVQKLLDRYS